MRQNVTITLFGKEQDDDEMMLHHLKMAIMFILHLKTITSKVACAARHNQD